MKKLFLTLGILVILICALTYLSVLRSEAKYLARRSKLFFVYSELTLFMPDRNNNKILIPPVLTENTTQSPISWREQIVNIRQRIDENFGYKNFGVDYSDMFRYGTSYGTNRTGDHTEYVAVVDKYTLWDEDIRNKILSSNYDFDKILLIEIPDKNIPWNSCQDYDINAAMNLWNQISKSRRFLQKQNLLYITLKGHIGFISDFKTKEEFQRMLVLSNEELLQLTMPVCACPFPPLENTTSNAQTDEN